MQYDSARILLKNSTNTFTWTNTVGLRDIHNIWRLRQSLLKLNLSSNSIVDIIPLQSLNLLKDLNLADNEM